MEKEEDRDEESKNKRYEPCLAQQKTKQAILRILDLNWKHKDVPIGADDMWTYYWSPTNSFEAEVGCRYLDTYCWRCFGYGRDTDGGTGDLFVNLYTGTIEGAFQYCGAGPRTTATFPEWSIFDVAELDPCGSSVPHNGASLLKEELLPEPYQQNKQTKPTKQTDQPIQITHTQPTDDPSFFAAISPGRECHSEQIDGANQKIAELTEIVNQLATKIQTLMDTKSEPTQKQKLTAETNRNKKIANILFDDTEKNADNMTLQKLEDNQNGCVIRKSGPTSTEFLKQRCGDEVLVCVMVVIFIAVFGMLVYGAVEMGIQF